MAEEMNQEERIEAATENQAAETLHAADASAGIAENASEAAASKADSATQNNRAEEPEATGELSELDQALLEVAELKEQLARRNADVYNVQQEYANYVKRTKLEAQSHKESGIQKVIEVLLGVLDNAALAREHGELTGPAGKVVEELENTLRTNFMLERFGAVGDEFDPQIHEALMHQTSPDAEKEEISVLIQAGYKQGEKVLRPARVGVVSPE
ncbi:nucleotide exchange factor GrpE [Arcanobacterium hippocoleae]|uniref:Protein GrpE n=1 Tax=Arcanobacterium hippocoleae TaxID=149017 RepID=A0ABU1T2R8_9ACTO|nr:nucleotide exchange factor GrpE [Arcanobacterium hippocoleae]MDR6939684.1 molecular chaperone GrpE [Arcanobacterium hippocoleae]